jgi:hypothetical protein
LAALGSSAQGDPDAVHLEPGQPVDRLPDHRFVLPAQEPVGGRSIPEVMFASAFPDKVPRMLLVDPHRAPTFAVLRGELAGMALSICAVPELDLVGILSRLRRHEPDAIEAAVHRVAEAFKLLRRRILVLEFPAD